MQPIEVKYVTVTGEVYAEALSYCTLTITSKSLTITSKSLTSRNSRGHRESLKRKRCIEGPKRGKRESQEGKERVSRGQKKSLQKSKERDSRGQKERPKGANRRIGKIRNPTRTHLLPLGKEEESLF